MDVYVENNKVRIDPTKSIGKGGEADVFDIGGKKALKIFKPPNHPDFDGLPDEQKGAVERIRIHQTKLPAFPKNLSKHVIVPEKLATNRSGNKIVGYVMSLLKDAEVLLRFADRGFRQQGGISNDAVIEIIKNLHKIVDGLHKANVVIGDFNDLNILVNIGTNEAYIIDTDSFQFGRFFCQVFTGKFVDPLLCDSHGKSLMLNKPHNMESDWYAFTIMLMQCLLFVGPYGGIYRPKDKTKKIVHDVRPLHRITVFHPEVKYPKPAVPYEVLPDELLQHFHLVFEKDQRGLFPIKLLDILHWTKCPNCSTEHARNVCPECTQVVPGAVKEVTQVRGTVISSRLFKTRGLILFATYQFGKMRWLYHENGQFVRGDNDSVITKGDLDPKMRFRIYGNSTIMAKNNQMVTLLPGGAQDRINVESFGNLPVFDANAHNRYWITNGQLLRDGNLGNEYIGDVLSNQTLFWVGQEFGFGFYRAGNISVAFVFDANRRGINDNVKIPKIRGQLVDSTCVFSKDRCWFFVTMNIGGKLINQCSVIKKDGTVEATTEAEENDGSWLATLRGKCAVSNFALVATDEGIVRVEPAGGQILETKKFPDTESFVDTGSNLFPGKDGIYVVDRQEIRLLKID